MLNNKCPICGKALIHNNTKMYCENGCVEGSLIDNGLYYNSACFLNILGYKYNFIGIKGSNTWNNFMLRVKKHITALKHQSQ